LQLFNYGSLERCLVALASYYYAGHIVSVLAFVVLSLLPDAKPRTKKLD
jgi:hypothetical protein